MTNLADYTKKELAGILTNEYGMPAYRAGQLYDGITAFDCYDEMTSLPKKLKEQLSEKYYDRALTIEKKLVSRDGTVKYLYRLNDGNIIEGAFMKQNYGNTLCVSTQVGCRMGCAFCASTLDGCARSLAPAEMLGVSTVL